MAKRLTKDERMAEEARRLAGLLVATDTGITAVPGLLGDSRLAVARKAWDDLAPRLAALGTLDELSRLDLAILCVYVADFIAAEDDILNHGFSVRVKTISGDRMPRENPAVGRRDFAAKMILDLGKHFGITKLDRLHLQRGRSPEATGLFDTPGRRSSPSAAPEAEPLGADELDWQRLTRPELN